YADWPCGKPLSTHCRKIECLSRGWRGLPLRTGPAGPRVDQEIGHSSKRAGEYSLAARWAKYWGAASLGSGASQRRFRLNACGNGSSAENGQVTKGWWQLFGTHARGNSLCRDQLLVRSR